MKNRSRLLSLLTAGALALTLTAPALATEVDDTALKEAIAEAEAILPAAEDDVIITTLPEPLPTGLDVEVTQEDEYEVFLEQFTAQYAQEHPEEQAAFDPHAYWQENFSEYWNSEEEFIEEMIEWEGWESADQFDQTMWESYVSDKANQAWQVQEVETYRAAHPGELEALTQEQLLAWQGYTETLTPAQQYMEDFPWAIKTEEDVLPYLLWDYVNDRNFVAETHETFLTYQAQYPEKWAEFDIETFFKEEYAWNGQTKEETMAYLHLFTEEEFVERMFTDYVEYHHWEWDYEEDDWGGWDDDPDYNYGSDKPLRLVVNGQVMENAVLSAQDGWSYADRSTLNAALGTHYVDEGEMVSIRAAAEAEGWDVGWNEHENAVFLIDKAAAKERIRESFTALEEILNWAVEHNRLEPGKSYKTTETCDITFTTLNSLDGDTDYQLRVTLEMLQKDNALELTVKVNAADLLKLIGDDILKLAADEIPQLSLSDLPTLMKGLELNAIADLGSGKFYWNVPVLSVFDDTVKPDTWYGADFGMGLEELLQEGLGLGSEELVSGLTSYLADYIYEEQLLSSSARWWNSPVLAWEEFDDMVSVLDAVMGPDRVSKSGGTLTWKVDTATMNGLFAQMSGTDVSLFKDYELSYVMRNDGTFSADMKMRPDFEGMMKGLYDSYDYYGSSIYSVVSILTGRFMGLLDFQVTAHSAGSMDKAAGTMEYHQKNAFKLKLDTETDRVETKTAPALTPPEGADVIMVVELGTELFPTFL